MNCISCGSPNIKFQLKHELLRKELYFCQKSGCYFEFMEVYQTIVDKNPNDLASSIGKSLEFLHKINIPRFVKEFEDFEIFSEEIVEKKPEIFFNNSNIIEFYTRYLNDSFANFDKFLIGPLTTNKILNKASDFNALILKHFKNNKPNKILIILKDSSNDYVSLKLTIEPLDVPFALERKKELLNKIKNDIIINDLFQTLKTENLLNQDLTNLEFEPKLANGLKMTTGCFVCLNGEKFIKGDEYLENITMDSAKNLMDKICQLLNSPNI